MKTVSFGCNEESVYLFAEIVNKLINASENKESKKVRVGGSEFEFKGGVDSICCLAINDKLYFDYTSDERLDFEKARIDALNPVSSIPVTSPIPVPSNIVATDITGATGATDTKQDDNVTNAYDASIMHDEVMQAVTDRLNNSEMFTAFDITKSFRNNGVKYPHNEVKKIVHNMFKDGIIGYDRIRTDKTGAPVQPFLYFPIGADPSTYQPS